MSAQIAESAARRRLAGMQTTETVLGGAFRSEIEYGQDGDRARIAQVGFRVISSVAWTAISNAAWKSTPVFCSRNMTNVIVPPANALAWFKATAYRGSSAASRPDLADTTLAPEEISADYCTVPEARGNKRTTTAEYFSEFMRTWKGLLAPDHFDDLAKHMERLLSDEGELSEDGIFPLSSSFDDLLAFLATRPWARSPAVGLNKRGQFSVSWTRLSPRRSDVTLTFLGDGTVKWYLFGLGKRGVGSATGLAQRTDLAEIFVHCAEWMAR